MLTVFRFSAEDVGKSMLRESETAILLAGEVNPSLCPREEQQLPQNSERGNNLAETLRKFVDISETNSASEWK